MFRPDDPLAPRKAVFDEPWQAQALAIADNLVRAGTFTASAWAEALGTALKAAEERGEPDITETYYIAVVEALEALTESNAGISSEDREFRRAAWEEAYHRTPHGQPVKLAD